MKRTYGANSPFADKRFRDHFDIDRKEAASPAPADTPGARAAALFDSGLLCSESVLLAVCREKGVRSKYIPRMATAFGGGLARTCGMCGALSGAIMAIGLFAGRDKAGQTQEDAYDLTRALLAWFAKQFSTTNCQELTGCDLGTEEGRRYFKDNELNHAICAGLVELTTEKALELITDFQQSRIQ